MTGDDGHPSSDRPVDDESSGDGLGSNGGHNRVTEDGSRGESDLLEDKLADAREERHRPETLPSANSQAGALEQYSGAIRFLKEVLTSVAAVLLVGALLFAISGVWPPMVAVESGSMEPVMERGDLVFITEPGRYAPDVAHGETGVVTVETGSDSGFTTFDGHGSVIVYDDPAAGGSPIIHRAHLWVEEDENWYDRANPEYVSANNCAQLTNCPAPHAGFITKGDANARYDQANGISDPVRPGWVTGVAQVRIPYLGWIRLSFGSLSNAPATTGPSTFPPVSTAQSVPPIEGAAATEAPPTDGEWNASPASVRPDDASSSAERCWTNEIRWTTTPSPTAVAGQ